MGYTRMIIISCSRSLNMEMSLLSVFTLCLLMFSNAEADLLLGEEASPSPDVHPIYSPSRMDNIEKMLEKLMNEREVTPTSSQPSVNGGIRSNTNTYQGHVMSGNTGSNMQNSAPISGGNKAAWCS